MNTSLIIFDAGNRYWILLCLAAVLLLAMPSCTSVSRTDPTTGITTKATIALSKAAYITVDGPVPTVQGYIPTLNKKGQQTGYKPVMGAPQAGAPHALFAAYDLDQVEGMKEIGKVITSSVVSVVTGQVLKAYDDNKTSIDKEAIAAQSKKDADAAALATTQANNAHAESMAGMELEAAAPAAAAATVP